MQLTHFSQSEAQLYMFMYNSGQPGVGNDQEEEATYDTKSFDYRKYVLVGVLL